jgi:hypothetical protein
LTPEEIAALPDYQQAWIFYALVDFSPLCGDDFTKCMQIGFIHAAYGTPRERFFLRIYHRLIRISTGRARGEDLLTFEFADNQ